MDILVVNMFYSIFARLLCYLINCTFFISKSLSVAFLNSLLYLFWNASLISDNVGLFGNRLSFLLMMTNEPSFSPSKSLFNVTQ